MTSKRLSCILNLFSDFNLHICHTKQYFTLELLYGFTMYILTQLHCNLLSVLRPSKYDIQKIWPPKTAQNEMRLAGNKTSQ